MNINTETQTDVTILTKILIITYKINNIVKTTPKFLANASKKFKIVVNKLKIKLTTNIESINNKEYAFFRLKKSYEANNISFVFFVFKNNIGYLNKKAKVKIMYRINNNPIKIAARIVLLNNATSKTNINNGII